MDRWMRESLDRYITGNYGEDQFKQFEREDTMSYADQYMKAKEEKKTKDISSTIFKFEKNGEQLLGELVGFEKITIQTDQGPSEVTKYTLQTDAGQVSCILGYSGDQAIKDSNVVNGDGLFIEYLGKKQISGGKQVNLFKIETFKIPGSEEKPFR